jgi:serine/threonine protein kinase
MSDRDLLDDLLLQWEEQFEQGRDVPTAQLCRTCPHLAGPLEEEIAKLKRIRSPRHLWADDAGQPEGAFAGMRYHPHRLHAAGGLGEVFLAHDDELGRTVALKRIKGRYAGRADVRARFEREAEITSRLEHPGVVPVYGMGHDASGQPFYAMRFIQGQTLQDALNDFHARHRVGSEARARLLALRPLLTRFISVCQTVAYAHSRGVIHRDLKPANIILGRYGETLVVDWGLAKVVGREEPHRDSAEDTVLTLEPGETPATQQGSTIGTPAYMSPEQAQGRWDVVGPASDVFSLGATLAAVLTGRPPLTDLRQAADGEPTPPRKLRADVPAALSAVCLKTMARDPAKRYATALDLAKDVEQWLADEPVTARREPWSERLLRWSRRHRRTVLAASAVVLTTLMALGVGLYFVDAERQRTELARQSEESERKNAEAARDLARQRFTQALLAYNAMVVSIQNKLEVRPGNQEVRKELLEKAPPQPGRHPSRVEGEGRGAARVRPVPEDLPRAVRRYPGRPTSPKGSVGRLSQAGGRVQGALRRQPGGPRKGPGELRQGPGVGPQTLSGPSPRSHPA